MWHRTWTKNCLCLLSMYSISHKTYTYHCRCALFSYGKIITSCDLFNALRPRQNGRHFAVNLFKCIFFNENVWLLLKISLKFVPKGAINNIPAMVQIMVRLPMHICVTLPRWVKIDLPAFWYSYDCPSVSEVTLFYMIKLAITKPQKYRKGMINYR